MDAPEKDYVTLKDVLLAYDAEKSLFWIRSAWQYGGRVARDDRREP